MRKGEREGRRKEGGRRRRVQGAPRRKGEGDPLLNRHPSLTGMNGGWGVMSLRALRFGGLGGGKPLLTYWTGSAEWGGRVVKNGG
jgi:hypothetical protein